METIEKDYKVGEKVYVQMTSDKKARGPYTIKRIYKTVAMKMASFEETGISVGICYLKRDPSQQNGKISDYLNRTPTSEWLIDNALGEGLNFKNRGMSQMEGIRNFAGNPDLAFFRPDSKMMQWLADYANGRLIIDVGCGTGRITVGLNDLGAKAMGVDYMLDQKSIMKLTTDRVINGKPMIHFLQRKIEDIGNFFQGQGNKVLLLFCRPCHSDFVINTARMKDPETELLYITVPENIERYNDLGHYQEQAVQITPEGRSADDEVFYSLR